MLKIEIAGKRQRNETVELQLDYGTRTWKLIDRHFNWRDRFRTNRGKFKIQASGETLLWVWPKHAMRNASSSLVVLKNAPRSSMDRRHRSGFGCVIGHFDFMGRNIRWKVTHQSRHPVAPKLSPIRKRIVEILHEVLPADFNSYNYWAGKKKAGTGAGVTNCNIFVGDVLKKVPLNHKKVAKDIVHRPRFDWKTYAAQIDRERSPEKPTFINYKPGRLPKPGDIYMLKVLESTRPGLRAGMIQHIGLVIDATATEWITGDGGQKGKSDSYACKKNRRRYRAAGSEIDGEFSEPAATIGWVDVDRLVKVAPEVFPANLR